MRSSRLVMMAAVALGVAGAQAGCATDESALYIRGVLVEASDTCVVTPDPTALERGGGIIDAALAGEYSAALLVGNQVTARGDNERLRTETSSIRITGVDVRVELLATGEELTTYSVPATGFIDADANNSPGYGVVFALLVDATRVADLGNTAKTSGAIQEAISHVRVRGTTLGGNDIVSGEYAFPVAVCYGCLVQFPGEADDPAKAGLDCDKTDKPPAPNCRIGRDALTDCRLCQGNPICNCPGNPLCPP